ncbi:MAG: class I SAM-dependent DNA methyltransferase [Egibacteraceae bacterium]
MSGRADRYDRRWEQRAAEGRNVHGEADYVESLGVRSVLDAGCGTGRVAIELARRGLEVVGVDADADMLAVARRKAPNLRWILADLATLRLPDDMRFEAVVMAGNVMLFLQPETERAVIESMAAHLLPGGLLVNGFQLDMSRLDLHQYDRLAADAGLEPAGRWGTWDRQPFLGGDYAVCIHRLAPLAAAGPLELV